MSLKAFHFVFVFFSMVLALACGSWCLWVNLVENAPSYLVGAAASFACALGFFIYGLWFYRKMKRLGLIS